MDIKIDASELSLKLIQDFRKALDFIGMKKVVIGLSGGVDSALAAVLISKSIGSENLMPVFMPYKTTNPASFEDAKALSDKFSLNMEIFDITEPIDAFFKNMPEASLLRRGNAMSRMRMTALFDRAAAENAIVGGTSNKTEIILGYGTWHGDTASSINIIGSLYKRQVYELSEFLELPKNIIDKEPSADLWQGQTDEDELGFSYDFADRFLYALFEEKKDRLFLENDFGKDLTNKILRRAASSSFKRRMPRIIGAPKTFFDDIEKRLSDFISDSVV